MLENIVFFLWNAMQEAFHHLAHNLWEPFLTYPFLMRGLLGCAALSLGCGSVGSFLVLRRMGLTADALSHGLFPGVALAFLFFGFSPLYLGLFGALTGIALASLAYGLSVKMGISKDSNFSILVLFSMALGLLILTVFGGYTDVMHILVGHVLVISFENLLFMGGVATATLLSLILFYRPLVLKAFDPQFFRVTWPNLSFVDFFFLILVTLNMVCAFQALGSLMALGLLLIPAITARLWTTQIWTLCLASTLLGMLASFVGLLVSYHLGYPAGPVIILTAVGFYVISLLSGSGGRFLVRSGLSLVVLAAFVISFHSYQLPHTPQPHIVVSFSVLKDFVKQIAGDRFVIKSLVGPNRDPHTFEPSPQDMIHLLKADMIIINGLHLENHWLPSFLSDKPEVGPVIIASHTSTPRFFKEGKQKIPDPHAWHNVAYAKRYVEVIKEALIKKWPQFTSEFTERAEMYQKKLDSLEAWIRAHISAIDPSKRHAITTHDGFGYFEEAYHFHFLTPLGPSTDAEPSPQDLAKLIAYAKTKNVRGIFLENMTPPHIIRMLAKEIGLTIGGTLYSDALSEPQGPASTYLHMMAHNVTMLLRIYDHEPATQPW